MAGFWVESFVGRRKSLQIVFEAGKAGRKSFFLQITKVLFTHFTTGIFSAGIFRA